ncbi:hypothetical protein H9Q70_005021 [Fusarium xylarioides]|nr:hypothetical protein H9Q70_005021 [Fusarium xylarioides]KAG5783914.1 hypothetical protein H9Q73_002414 [Fusarium xylarioides]
MSAQRAQSGERQNAYLHQKLDDEVFEWHREIHNLKTEQAIAIAALKEVTTGQALAIAALQEVTTKQASLIDDLKAKLETRETEARRFSERLAELEGGQSETDTKVDEQAVLGDAPQ